MGAIRCEKWVQNSATVSANGGKLPMDVLSTDLPRRGYSNFIMQCVTMRDVNEGLMANMIADGDDLRRIYETLAVLSKKIDLMFEMMQLEQEQRLASMKAQQPSN
jgi:hypothetical protein